MVFFMKKKQFIAAICLVEIVLGLGCESPVTLPQKRYDGVLKHSSAVHPTIIHPILTFDSISAHIVSLIFNGIMKVTQDGNITTDLAETCTVSRDALEYSVKLKKGIKFHDGKELTSEDVKFTYDQIMELYKNNTAPIYNYDFSKVKYVEIIDKYNIKITLEQACATFLHGLSLGILPKHIYQKKDNTNDDIYWRPVGTGPFKLTSIDNYKIELTRFDDYFRGKACLEKIICEINSPSVTWAKLLRGEIDYTRQIPLEVLSELKKVDFLRTYDVLEPASFGLYFNCKNPFLKNKKIRQALNYAIDKKTLIKKTLDGRAKTCTGVVLPGSWAYNDKLAPYEYNPKKAAGLLSELGWTINQEDGFLYEGQNKISLKCLMFSKFPNIKKPTIFIQHQLNELGIKMEIKVIDNVEEFYEEIRAGKWDVFFGRFGLTVEFERIYNMFHSSRIGATNLFNYRNAQVDNLLDRGRRTLNKGERKEIYNKFQRVFLDDPPAVFVFYKQTTVVINKRIKGAVPDNFYEFKGVEQWWVAGNES